MEREVSEFNSGVSYSLHLLTLSQIMDASKLSFNFPQWYDSLNVFFQNLSCYMTVAEVADYKQKRDAARLKINEYILRQKRTNKPEVPNGLYEELEELEIILRRLWLKSGLLNRNADSELSAENW